jgi:hypothetical protein
LQSEAQTARAGDADAWLRTLNELLEEYDEEQALEDGLTDLILPRWRWRTSWPCWAGAGLTVNDLIDLHAGSQEMRIKV